MKNLILSVVMATSLIIGVTGVANAATPSTISVSVEGQTLHFDQPPVKVNDRTLVPLRAIFETLGASIDWNDSTQTVTASKDGVTIILQIGSKTAYKNGQSVTLDVEAQLINDRTMVPVRFVTEALGANVNWDENTQTVIIKQQPGTTGQKLTTQQIVSQSDKKIVMIETSNAQGPFALGSGICIKDGLFLTNYHVMDGATSAKIKTVDGKEYDVQGLVVYDKKLDLAVIKTKQKPNLEPVTLGSPKNSLKGDHVVAIGSPEGLQNTVSEGIIGGFRTANGVDFVQISVPITHGSSGGGLFNDNGDVIAVTSKGFEDGSLDLNFAISVDHMKPWLTGVLNQNFESLQTTWPPVDSAKQVSMTAAELQKLLESKYSSIPTKKGSLSLGLWHAFEENGVMYINADISAADYLKYRQNYPDIEQEVHDWAKSMGSTLDTLYPQKNVLMMVFFQGESSEFPTGFTLDEISKLNNGNWLVTHWIASISLSSKIVTEVRP